MKRQVRIFPHSIASFSLMELLVTVFIVSILATIALPSYNHYVKRARLVKIIVLLQRGAEEISTYYLTHDGTYPTKIFDNVVTAGNTGSTSVNFGYTAIKRIIYINTGLTNPSTKALIQFRLNPTDINVSSLTPTDTTAGVTTASNNYNAIGIAMYPNTASGKEGSMVMACGVWNSGDIETKFLPTECQTVLSGTF